MLTRMGKPLTPEDAKFESLIDTLQFRMSQLAGGTAKKVAPSVGPLAQEDGLDIWLGIRALISPTLISVL